MLSKPYAESSGGSIDVTSTSTASTSRMAFAYLRAIQPVQHRPARIGVRGRRSIELPFKPTDEPFVRGRVRTPRGLRRHGAGVQPPHDFFPRLSRIGDAREIQVVEGDLTRRLFRPLVVTRDAVSVQCGAVLRGKRRGRDGRRRRALRARSLWAARRGRCEERSDADEKPRFIHCCPSRISAASIARVAERRPLALDAT